MAPCLLPSLPEARIHPVTQRPLRYELVLSSSPHAHALCTRAPQNHFLFVRFLLSFSLLYLFLHLPLFIHTPLRADAPAPDVPAAAFLPCFFLAEKSTLLLTPPEPFLCFPWMGSALLACFSTHILKLARAHLSTLSPALRAGD